MSPPRFPEIDTSARVRDVSERLDDVDAVLLTDLHDVRWLTGFTGSNGWAVLSPEGVVLGTDGRYRERAAAECRPSGATVVAEQSQAALHERMLDLLRPWPRVGLDDSSVPYRTWVQLAKDLAPSTDLVPGPSVVGRLRQVKDAAEVARIEYAAACADAALADVEPMIRDAPDEPVRESDLRNELEYRMRLHGADDRSYDTIVASGPEHAARPHHEVGHRLLQTGDTVIIDVGALVDGYHSDMTRSWVVGPPSAEQREWYELVSAAHRAGIAALAPGVAAAEVDRASRDVFREAGVAEWFVHGTGHAVGLVIHEAPFHGPTSTDTIRAGNVVTVEPGLYRVGFGGFRIEDLLVVEESGPRALTHAAQRPFDS